MNDKCVAKLNISLRIMVVTILWILALVLLRGVSAHAAVALNPDPSSTSIPAGWENYLRSCDTRGFTPSIVQWISPNSPMSAESADVPAGTASLSLKLNSAGAVCYSSSVVSGYSYKVKSASINNGATLSGLSGTGSLSFSPHNVVGTYNQSSKAFTASKTGGFTAGTYTITVVYEGINTRTVAPTYDCTRTGGDPVDPRSATNYDPCQDITTTFNFQVTVQTGGGGGSGAITCIPSTQTVSVGQAANFTHTYTDSTGTSSWSAPGGNPSSWGNYRDFSTTYSSNNTYYVTVSRPYGSSTCTVYVGAPAPPPPPPPPSTVLIVEKTPDGQTMSVGQGFNYVITVKRSSLSQPAISTLSFRDLMPRIRTGLARVDAQPHDTYCAAGHPTCTLNGSPWSPLTVTVTSRQEVRINYTATAADIAILNSGGTLTFTIPTAFNAAAADTGNDLENSFRGSGSNSAGGTVFGSDSVENTIGTSGPPPGGVRRLGPWDSITNLPPIL